MPADLEPLVLLDLDGTLIDSAPGIVASAAHAFGALGLPAPDGATLRTFVGPPITTSFAAHGVPTARMDEAVTAYRDAYSGAGLLDATVYPGIPDQLERLRSAGCRLVVATSKPTIFAVPICEALGLASMVDSIHGATLDESRSSKAMVVGEALAGSAALESPRLMVGDREHDVHGAAAHGIDCLGATWGYAPAGELERAGAVALVHDPADLASSVLRLVAAR